LRGARFGVGVERTGANVVRAFVEGAGAAWGAADGTDGVASSAGFGDDGASATISPVWAVGGDAGAVAITLGRGASSLLARRSSVRLRATTRIAMHPAKTAPKINLAKMARPRGGRGRSKGIGGSESAGGIDGDRTGANAIGAGGGTE
jgi:hypothetical protein